MIESCDDQQLYRGYSQFNENYRFKAPPFSRVEGGFGSQIVNVKTQIVLTIPVAIFAESIKYGQ